MPRAAPGAVRSAGGRARRRWCRRGPTGACRSAARGREPSRAGGRGRPGRARRALSPAAGSRGAKAARAVICGGVLRAVERLVLDLRLDDPPDHEGEGTTASSAIRVTEAMKLWRQRLRTAWPSAVILVSTPPATSHLDGLRGLRYLRAAGTSLIWPAGGGHGREDRGCGRHARGGGRRRARERWGRGVRPARFGHLGTRRAQRDRGGGDHGGLARRRDRRRARRLRARASRRRDGAFVTGPRRSGGAVLPAAARTPSAGLPTIPVPQGGGGGGAGPAQPPGSPSQPAPPSQGGQAIDAAGNTVEQVGHQAPAVQPITDPVGRLTHQVADTCRRLPACPCR